MTRETGRIGETILRVGPVLAYCAAIYIVSAMGEPPAPDFVFEWGDKVAHAAAYALMGVLALRATRWLMPERSFPAQAVAAFLFCFIYGGLDEIHQSFVPGRHADIYDWIADGVGAALGIIATGMIRRTALVRLVIGEPGAGDRPIST